MLRAGGAPKGVPGPGAAREGREGREGEVGRWQERRKRGLRVSVVHGVREKSPVPGAGRVAGLVPAADPGNLFGQPAPAWPQRGWRGTRWEGSCMEDAVEDVTLTAARNRRGSRR